PHWTYATYLANELHLGTDTRDVIRDLTVYAVGALLDRGVIDLSSQRAGYAPAVPASFEALEEYVKARAIAKSQGTTLPGVSDEEAFAYFGAKVYRSYEFRYPETTFGVADEVRLNMPAGDLERIALAGEDTY